MGIFLLIVVTLMMVASLPRWDYSRGWKYFPAAGLGALLMAIVVLMIFRVIPLGF